MPRKKLPLDSLDTYLPEGAWPLLKSYFENYPIQLILTKERKTKYGDYSSPPTTHARHRITVNGNLHAQHFLITLLHELAHMLVNVHFPKRVKPHGAEWKKTFAAIMQPFLAHGCFENEVVDALHSYMKNPAATSCVDAKLHLVLKKYDPNFFESSLLASLPQGSSFALANGKKFIKLEKLRTRYKCKSLDNGYIYLVPQHMSVQPIT